MNRSDELLNDLAGQFEKQCSIANDEWLREKDVTMTEIDGLFAMAALLLESYAKGNPKQKAAMMIACVDALAK